MATEFHLTPQDAARALFRHVVANSGDYPADMRDRVLRYLEPGRSPSQAVAEAAEMIFARKSELPQSVVKIGAEMAILAADLRINDFSAENGKRGRGIMQALRRHSREKAPEGMSWPPKEEDPVPKKVYVPGPPGDGESPPLPHEVPPPDPSTRPTGDQRREK